MVSGNRNINDGANRTLVIDGPGDDFDTRARTLGGNVVEANYVRAPWRPQSADADGGCLQHLNVNTITGWESNNRSENDFTAPANIVPPRVIRFGAQFRF